MDKVYVLGTPDFSTCPLMMKENVVVHENHTWDYLGIKSHYDYNVFANV
jgi:hypothetical protein